MRPDSLLVIGLGPVGGSLAWTAVRAGIPRVVGYAGERRDAVQAVSAGAVHEIADRIEWALPAADLVIITVPGTDSDLLPRLAPHLRSNAFLSTVVDLARPAARAVRSAGLETRWAASHPLRGVTGDGFAAARPELFRGAVVYVTSAAEAVGDGAAREVMHFWEDVIGAEPVRIAADAHDETVGWMEQLPRLLAVSVATAFGTQGLGAQSWGSDARTMTALAEQEPAQLAAALITNREAALAAVTATTGALGALGAAISAGDAPLVVTLLEEARRIRRGSDR